ncbi:hypothetical protein QE152_g10249 [Popillia japonica]|uniref:Uncharacterized protein n=1 Tax=Popillia japonica TaxID=7064 RepID=A0AAW1LW81_POPJA
MSRPLRPQKLEVTKLEFAKFLSLKRNFANCNDRNNVTRNLDMRKIGSDIENANPKSDANYPVFPSPLQKLQCHNIRN